MRTTLLLVLILPVCLLALGCGGDEPADGGGRTTKSTESPGGGASEEPVAPAPVVDPKVDVVDLNGFMDVVEGERDGYLVVNLFADWCDDCISELPALVALSKAIGARGQLVGASVDWIDNQGGVADLDAAVEAVRARAKKSGLAYPIHVLKDTEVSAMFEYLEVEHEVPHTVIFDKDGIKVADHAGFDSAAEATAWFEKAIQGE
jgi:thiol-disulfide isomerase/thioredoxin